MRLSWNSATSFGLCGALLAVGIALPFFGWQLVFLPALLAGLIATYGTSTWFGRYAARKAGNLFACVTLGVVAALATLLAGSVAVGATNALLSWLEHVTAARWGLGPFFSIGHAIDDFVLTPTLAVVIYGGWIAVVLGVAYGIFLHSSNRPRG